MSAEHPVASGVVFVAMMMLCLGGAEWIAANRRASVKKRWLPAFLSITGLVLLVTLVAVGVSIGVALLAAVVMLAIGAILQAQSRFCPVCKLSSTDDPKLLGADFCPRCGTKLTR